MENRSCEDLQDGYLPTAQEYFETLHVGYIVGISLCGGLTLLVLASYIESVVFLIRNLANWKPRDKAIWLLGLYPLHCVTSLFTLTVPRTALLNELVSSMYLSLCVYLFVVMLMGHFGGTDKMSKRLRLTDGTQIDPRRPPLCCCCRCLPLCDITKFRIQLLELTVLQFAVLRPVYSYITATIWANNGLIDDKLQQNMVYSAVSFCDVVSTLLAGWGFSVVFKISQIPLEKMSIKPKFIILQMVMLISTFQPVFIAVLISVGVIPCHGTLTATANGLRWHHMVYIVEMCGLSWFSRYYYRRHVGDIPPEEKVTQDTRDQRTSTTETLNRMAEANQILRAGARERSKYNESDKRNKYIQHSKPSSSRGPSATGISTGTDPVDFDDLKQLPQSSSSRGPPVTAISTGTDPVDVDDLKQIYRGSSKPGFDNTYSMRTSLIEDNQTVTNTADIVLDIK